MPAHTVVLFYPTHFYWCVLRYVYYCSCNSRAQVTLAMGIVLIILDTPMLGEIPEWPGVQGWALKVTSSRGTRQLMVNHFVVFLKPCVALCIHSQSSSLRDKTSQHHLASAELAVMPNYSPLSCVCNYKLLVKTTNWSLWKLHCISITLPHS
jgi:hypothetical protein